MSQELIFSYPARTPAEEYGAAAVSDAPASRYAITHHHAPMKGCLMRGRTADI